MNSTNLYIIGNGFDIYHGIDSHYSDFKEYLSTTNINLHDHIEEFVPADENWSDLESALAGIDIDGIIDNASQFLMSYGAEDWSDSYHHDYQYEVNNIINSLSSELRACFAEWVRQLNIPKYSDLKCQPLNVDANSKYLSFNYTATLEIIYRIPTDKTLFIHGCAKESGQELILGHAWNPADIPSLNDVSDPESMDTRVMEGNEIINQYFGATFKPTKDIIEQNTDYFRSLCNVTNIFILGHSLSEVDFEYFQAIISNIDTSLVNWVISYYGATELNRHKQTMHNLGIDKENLEFKELHTLIKC